MTDRPNLMDANGVIRPLTDAEFAQYQADQAAFATLPPPVTTPVISDRQFFQQLAVTPDPTKSDGSMLITQDEAIAAVSTGAIPVALQPLIAALPSAEQFAATMKLKGATQFDIADPITIAVATAYGWITSSGDRTTLVAFWTAAAAL